MDQARAERDHRHEQKKDANETVGCLLEDAAAGALGEPAEPSREAIESLIRERRPQLVSYSGWEAIDRSERDRGEQLGRPRVKHCTYDDLVRVATSADAEMFQTP